MGLLSNGTPLDWDDAQQYADHVRQHGIIQLLNIYRRLKNKTGDALFWGDELEYMLIALTDPNGEPAQCIYAKDVKASLSLNGFDLLTKLQQEEEEASVIANRPSPKVLWRPEFAKYMLEALPGWPHGPNIRELLRVESNMKLRRHKAMEHALPHERLLSMVSFPLLGALRTKFLYPHVEMTPATEEEKTQFGHGCGRNEHSRSLFIPDDAINPHPRFRTLQANIRKRRGHKQGMNLPIYKDTHTPSPFVETDLPSVPEYPNPYDSGEALPDHVYMDCMCFGMGCCCLQITFQASTIDEARKLYDQLAVVSPIGMALSAGSPIFRGYLVDTDCRWDVIAGSVDDRNPHERGIDNPSPLLVGTIKEPKPTSSALQKRRIPKSRYGSVSCFISDDPRCDSKYNDVDLPYDQQIETKLRQEMDPRLARHFAHLFIRDPLVIYQELVEQDDEVSSDHFENIQSTNWQTMRFKPPPPGTASIGWRVEFRSLEVQLTDFENAAFVVFVVLLTRCILTFDLNMYMPISKVDQNMDAAARRDSLLEQKFWMRRHIFPDAGDWARMDATACSPFGGARNRPSNSDLCATAEGQETDAADVCSGAQAAGNEDPDELVLLTVDEIINGKTGIFPGFIPMIEVYLSNVPLDVEASCRLGLYLEHIRNRANGTVPTNANWMRRFVRTHAAYKFDSVVSEEIANDLVKKCVEIGEANVLVAEAPYRV